MDIETKRFGKDGKALKRKIKEDPNELSVEEFDKAKKKADKDRPSNINIGCD